MQESKLSNAQKTAMQIRGAVQFSRLVSNTIDSHKDTHKDMNSTLLVQRAKEGG